MTDELNPFQVVGDRQIVGPRKARMRAAATRSAKVQSKLDGKKAEQNVLYVQWQKWKEDRRKELCEGPHGQAATDLSVFLDAMHMGQAEELIDFVRLGPWQNADRDARFMVLDMISNTITYKREQLGLEPFDDPLPDDEPNAFVIIRDLLK